MATTSLLRLLADGRFHSGSAIGETLGLSRAAVWKQVGKLADLGLDVHAVRGKGYCIPGGVDLLDADVIRQLLPAQSRLQLDALQVFDTVDSTNSVAASWSRAGGGAYACLAERQTAGRGRRGRTWISPFGANIYLTVTWEFQGGVAAVAGLSLAVGVAVCDAIRSLGVTGVALKWPNDIVVNGLKLGGILIELSGDLGGTCRAVIGLGLNVKMPVTAGGSVDQPWTDLVLLGITGVTRSEIAARLLTALLAELPVFEQHGLSPFGGRWAQYDSCRDQPVEILSGSGRVAGFARGIDPSGALLLEADGKVMAISTGEVSLRRIT